MYLFVSVAKIIKKLWDNSNSHNNKRCIEANSETMLYTFYRKCAINECVYNQ